MVLYNRDVAIRWGLGTSLWTRDLQENEFRWCSYGLGVRKHLLGLQQVSLLVIVCMIQLAHKKEGKANWYVRSLQWALSGWKIRTEEIFWAFLRLKCHSSFKERLKREKLPWRSETHCSWLCTMIEIIPIKILKLLPSLKDILKEKVLFCLRAAGMAHFHFLKGFSSILNNYMKGMPKIKAFQLPW